MVKLEKAILKDAKTLLKLQYDAFIVYSKKYGDFDSNPYHMSLERMEFNIKYRFGQYYKLIEEESNELIGGIFAFELDDPAILKIAQFYIKDGYRSKGYGQYVLTKIQELNPLVKTWYVDTILQEEYNVKFYEQAGFEVVDEEIEHDGLTFVTFIKKVK